MTTHSHAPSLRRTKPSSSFPAPHIAPFARDLSSAAGFHLLPAHPASIPVEPAPRLPLQAKLEVGSAHSPLEDEADAMAAGIQNGSRAPARDLPSVEAPPVVHEALSSPAQALDASTRALMEPRFSANLDRVRIHAGAQAAQAARAVHAQAYTVGQDIFFAAGRYNPHSGEGQRLLAHELTHAVQQSGGAAGLSAAPRAVARQPQPGDPPKAATPAAPTDAKKPQAGQVTVPVPPAKIPDLKLPPALAAQAAAPGAQPPAAAPAQAAPSAQPAAPSPAPLAPLATPGPALTPPAGGAASPGVAPKAPDRVNFADVGVLSFGARIGFPDLSKDTDPNAPSSALQESIKQGEIINYHLTGQLPSQVSIDPAKVVGAAWGIFSTQISPATAAKIAAGMASKPKGSGPTFQLDTTILLDLGGTKKGGGAGATLTVNF